MLFQHRQENGQLVNDLHIIGYSLVNGFTTFVAVKSGKWISIPITTNIRIAYPNNRYDL